MAAEMKTWMSVTGKTTFFVANDLNVRAVQHAWYMWKGRKLVSHCLCIVNKLIKLECPSPVMLADMRALKAFCQNITTETNSYNYCVQAFSCVRTLFLCVPEVQYWIQSLYAVFVHKYPKSWKELWLAQKPWAVYCYRILKNQNF